MGLSRLAAILSFRSLDLAERVERVAVERAAVAMFCYAYGRFRHIPRILHCQSFETTKRARIARRKSCMLSTLTTGILPWGRSLTWPI